MTVEEIQQVLRTLHRDSLERSATLRSPHSGADLMAMYAVVESEWMEDVRPAPSRTTLTFAGFSFEEQEQIEEYAQQLIDEAQGLVLRLQEQCQLALYGAVDEDALFGLKRWYRARHHAMKRLRRRWDDWQWISAHIRKARRWLEEAYVEYVN